ncbi:MAG: GHKL domain-containing protein [Oscillospiraceae bacterium]
MLLVIFNVVVFTVEMLTMLLYCRNIFDYRTDKTSATLLAVAGYFCLFIINFMFEGNPQLNVLCLTIINSLIIFLGFNCKYRAAAFHSIVLIAVMISTEMLSILFISSVLKLSISHYNDNTATYLIDGIIGKTLYFVVCRMIFMFSPKEKNNKISGKSWYLLIMPATAICMLLVLRIFADFYDLSQSFALLFALAGVLLMACTIIVYFAYEKIQVDSQKILDLEVEKKKEETDKTYFEVLDNQVSELKILVHDIKNHLVTIKSISDDKAVSDYIDSIYEGLQKYSKIGQSGNKILDLVISKYSSLCAINDISFNTNVHSSNLSFMEDSDASAMLNNLLDNAFEAAKKSKERTIELSVYNKTPFCMLVVINSSDNPPIQKSQNLITSKDENSFHGYGTKSIQKVASKYDGDFSWHYDETEKMFYATIMLPINEKKVKTTLTSEHKTNSE